MVFPITIWIKELLKWFFFFSPHCEIWQISTFLLMISQIMLGMFSSVEVCDLSVFSFYLNWAVNSQRTEISKLNLGDFFWKIREAVPDSPAAFFFFNQCFLLILLPSGWSLPTWCIIAIVPRLKPLQNPQTRPCTRSWPPSKTDRVSPRLVGASRPNTGNGF